MSYPINSFTIPSKTYNKVLLQQYYKVRAPLPHKMTLPPKLWFALPPKMMTLQCPPTSLLLRIP